MKILIAGISVRAMAESAVRGGYRVVAVDAFGDRDLVSLAESHALHRDFSLPYGMHALIKVCRGLHYDAVAYTSNLENHPKALEGLAGNRKIIGNAPRTVEAVRNWEVFFAGLRRAGFAVPETILPGVKKSPESSRRWLVKPLLSGGGHGVEFWDPSKPPGKEFMLQEYIRGKPCSASFVANGRDCVVLGITEQLAGASSFGSKGFRYCGNILPLPEAVDPALSGNLIGQVRRVADYLTREYGLTGVNGIDFILGGEKIFLTEVNPRYSASMELIEQAYGLPVFHLHAESALHSRLPEFRLEDALGEKEFFGKAILFAERNAVAPDTKGWLDSGARDIPASGEPIRKGSPVCTVLAQGPAFEDTLAELVRRAGFRKESIYE